jgi:hypothetical protein
MRRGGRAPRVRELQLAGNELTDPGLAALLPALRVLSVRRTLEACIAFVRAARLRA